MYVVMDLEIKDHVSETNGGWDAARKGKLGISCLCLYDSKAQRYFIYDDNNLDECARHLESADVVVTFNGREFDIPCLQGVLGQTLKLSGHYDILQEIWRALGRRTKGYSLGAVSERTLGLSKSGAGESAPTLWTQRRLAELHTYCLSDVHLTLRLFDFITEYGYILDISGSELPMNQYHEALDELD